MVPEWFDWKHPDYESVFALRASRLTQIRLTSGMADGLMEYYKDNPGDFIDDWGCTFDPRNVEIGLPATVPFLLFPRQREFVEWVIKRWRAREDGLAEKSRDMGVSWLCVAVAVWMWLFHGGTVIGFGSRKEEYVDKIGDPKSLLWKVRQFIALLPREFRPKGYAQEKHAPHMRVLNPENGSAIIGEAGDNIGRGNRTSLYFKDEAAFLEHQEAVEAALSMTSNCKLDVSTVNGAGNAFHRKRHAGCVPVFTFHWHSDPRKDAAWYAKQKEKLDPVILAQEVDIDYNASSSDAWVPGSLIIAAQSNGPADVEAVGNWVISVDAAHFGDDESVIHCRCGRLNLKQVIRRQMDGPQLAWLVEEQARVLERSGKPVSAIVMELDGPGVSCYDQLRMGRYAEIAVGLHTGARLDDGKNYNVRAMLARKAKEYLETPPVCMHDDAEIRIQGAAMGFKYKNGLLLMESKQDYKSRLGRSPDRWDAFVLSFGADDPRRKQRGGFPGHRPASGAGY